MNENTKTELLELLPAIVLTAFSRNYRLENFLWLISRLEQYLRGTFEMLRLQEWLPGFYQDGVYHCGNGEIGIQWNRRPLNLAEKNLLIAAWPLDWQPDCEPLLTEYCADGLFGPGWKTINGHWLLQTTFLMVRLYSCLQPIPIIRLRSLQDFDHPLTLISERLQQYDKITVNYLAPKFGIVDGLVSDSNNSNGMCVRTYIDPNATYDAGAELISFNDANGVPVYYIERVKNGNDFMLLPVSFYQCPSYGTKPLRLYIPPPPPFPLYNADRIAQYQDAIIIFTDELAIALYHQSNHRLVISSYYGNDDAIPHLDITPLIGRHVVWLLLDKPGALSPKDRYTTAVKIAEHLNGHGINLEFAEILDLKWVQDNTGLLIGKHQGIVL